jgi:phage terminase small subunit
MSGRRRKPTALHHLHGTFNVTDHADRQYEAVAEGELELDDAPPSLTPDQVEGWRYALEHAPRDVLKKIDRTMLAAWVIAEEQLYRANRLQAHLDKRRTLQLLMKGRPSPYDAIIDRASRRLMTAASILGFAPTARPRIQVRPTDTVAKAVVGDPWELLRLRVVPGGRAD